MKIVLNVKEDGRQQLPIAQYAMNQKNIFIWVIVIVIALLVLMRIMNVDVLTKNVKNCSAKFKLRQSPLSLTLVLE